MTQEQALQWIIDLILLRYRAFRRWPTTIQIHADIFDAAFPEENGEVDATHEITVQGHVVVCIRSNIG